MASKQSTPEIRAAAFIAAREKCALSVEELAHLACLSKKQIQQIENGGRDTFYSPTIKFNAAKKVAKLIQLDEKDAFDFGPQVELSLAPVDELAQSESQPAKPTTAEDAKKESAESELTKPSLAIDSKESPPAKPNASQKSDGVSAVPKKSVQQAKKPIASTPAEMEGSKPKTASKAWLWLLPACALAIALVQFQPLLEDRLDALMGKPKPVEVAVVIAAPADAAPASPPAEPVSTPAAVTPPVATVITPSPALAVAASPACPMPDASIENYKSPSANKPGNMVFIKVPTAQTVCVEDGDGKVQIKAMDPNFGHSFYGKPPFKLMSSGLSSAEIFFQGLRVRPNQPDAKSILLIQAD